jgi:hypothetical protein
VSELVTVQLIIGLFDLIGRLMATQQQTTPVTDLQLADKWNEAKGRTDGILAQIDAILSRPG